MLLRRRSAPFALACLCVALLCEPSAHAATNVTINVTGSITPGTCTVGNLSIPIGDVDAAAFNAGGVSPTTPEYAFKLSCQGSPAVTLKVTGTASPSTQYPHLFGIAQGDQSASGVGVELMMKGNTATIYPNSTISITQSASGTVDVPISARYVQTGPITAGWANAFMTATFSYK